MRWTRKSIITEIKRLHDTGEPLNYSAAETNHLNLVRASAWHYGTWRRAVEAAGIEYESLSRYQRWDKERIVSRIQELHKKKADLSWRSVSTQLDPSLAAAALRPNGFRSWREAVAAAGIDVENVTRYKYWDNEKVIKAIKARKKQGEPMSSKSLQTSDQSLFCAARRRFGSWDAALDAAGLNAEKIRLRRHTPRLNAPRKKKADEVAVNASKNGTALKTASSTKSSGNTKGNANTRAKAASLNGKAATAKVTALKVAAPKATAAKAAPAKATNSKTNTAKAARPTTPQTAASKTAASKATPAAKAATPRAGASKKAASKAAAPQKSAAKPAAQKASAAAKQSAAKSAKTSR